MSVDECVMEIERRFLEAQVDDLAQWLEWTADASPAELLEAKRLVEDARLLAWVQDQNSKQGISPPPLFVWEKRCALSIENSSVADARASPHRSPRSAAGLKWVQRFRRRWGLVVGRLPAKDILPVDTMRKKVPSCMKK